jgi:uncharacterized protein YkwD
MGDSGCRASRAQCPLVPNLKHIFIAFSVGFCALTLGAGRANASSVVTQTTSVLGQVNAVRAAHGLRPLAVDTKLARAARAYSATLLRTDSFTHGALGPRLSGYGVRGPLFGENLAWGVGSRASARSIVRAWLASPGHRANLLRPGFRRIGIGARVGTFQGHGGATVVTADFAGH